MADERMTYVPTFRAEGHDPGCAAHHMEPCDCASGIVRTIELAFAADLQRIMTTREATDQAATKGASDHD